MNKLKTAALCLISLVLTGCTSPNFSVEGLVDAPKLTEEQSQIHEALTKSVGSNITLKYPRNGDYRSAYVIANIDSEPDNEAIVFYEYKETNKEKGMKINILDTDEDGEWFSVKEVSGAGTDVDKVIVSQLGSGSDTNVVIGYMNQSADEKTMEVYSYKDDDFKKIGTDTYSVLEAMDFDNNGRNDLVAIQKTVNAETEKITAKASLLKLEKGEIKREMTIDMLDNVESYVKVTRGLLADGRHALFIDGSTSDGNIQTELLYYRYSTLQNPVQQRKEKLLSACTGNLDFRGTCMDIDGDGVVEIPSVKPMPGYENVETPQQKYLVTWNTYKDFYVLEEKYSGYQSNSSFIAFPKRWEGKVTVKTDIDTGEVIFYKYTGDVNTSTTELVRYCSGLKEDDEKLTAAGYELITSKGQLNYYVKIPKDKTEQLVLTIDEVKNNFYPTE